MKKQSIFYIVVALFLIILGVFALVGRNGPANSGRSDSERNFPQVPERNATARGFENVGVDSAGVGSVKVFSDHMLTKYNQSKNIRDFVFQALQHPEFGGIYYATDALKKCQNFLLNSKSSQAMQSKNQTGIQYAAISGAADFLQSRCGGLLPTDFSNEHIEEILSSDASKKDPLLKLSKEIKNLTSSDPEKRSRSLEGILLSGDPLVVQEAGSRIALQTDAKTGARGYRFEGDFYPIHAEPDVGLALYILPCSLGLDCGNTDWEVAVRCANGAECASSRQEIVANMLSNRPGSYQKVMDISLRMARAIQQGNIAAFQ
ncbi:hypothetical protein [Acidovorax sp. NCPPB 4044]|uniref:hypothetical protein n=1 Tax=Acidovorax sp. NCPPB 4044 TaxID=2940490 RepID=UPI00230419BF|nr:hypothetical protein [Acidovorax sp. NCPPB 4044]MDA8523434.1 hypothetical protein [Acidovorax sp. NCPPB 4044]